MRCPHCQEYDIENEVEIDPVYTEAEHTRIQELEEELDNAYTIIGETAQELARLRVKLQEVTQSE